MTDLEFQFTATNFKSMAAKLSDLVNKMSGANLQTEGHMDIPSQSAKDLWESEELGAVPPPSHSWMAPLVEDMLCEVRTRLTKVVVTGPGRAVLFYGIHSMGEGLTADEARDVTFLLTGAGTWVGKLVLLTADPMMIQEG